MALVKVGDYAFVKVGSKKKDDSTDEYMMFPYSIHNNSKSLDNKLLGLGLVAVGIVMLGVLKKGRKR